VAGLGLGTAFAGMLSHLTSSVIGTAAFGTLYLTLAPGPGRAEAARSFAVVNLALAVTALTAAAMAALSVRGQPASARDRGETHH
jgi:hypothetical protein